MAKKQKPTSISKEIKTILKKIERLEGMKKLEELEGKLPKKDEGKTTNMLKINTEEYDIFGDPMGLVTGSRLKDYDDALDFARSFVVGKHHRMMGNRYGKHSLLIKKEYIDNGKVDPYLISAYPHRIIIIKENGEDVEYYKIRMLVTDILTIKLLLTRIPTSDGKARWEEIQHAGAIMLGKDWLENKIPVPPMYIPKYTDKNKKEAPGLEATGDAIFLQQE